MKENTATEKLRLDKWLWAARFFKTRSIAREMIEGGKVDYNGVRAKPSRTVEIGAKIKIMRGGIRMEVEVLQLSDIRGPASVAQQLYKETTQSIEARQKQLEQLRLNALLAPHPDTRPNKKERRQLLDVKYGQN